ncbi:MAG: efflux RND transporter permease subunit [Chthoniobacteraceae bacterium]
MKITDLFVRRPVLATVVNLIVLIAGLTAIKELNVRQYPRSDIAVVTVTTTYVGAAPDLVQGFITTPLKRVIASADGIDYMESSSTLGTSTITVHLVLNYDTNAALTQIQAKVAQVRNDLPTEAEAPVIDVKNNDDQRAAMYLSFSSKDLAQNQITDYLTRIVQPKISAISGVQRADILGARTFAMRIWLHGDRMAALNISPTDLRTALAANNYLSALGQTNGSMVTVNLVANTDLKSVEDFKDLVVKHAAGNIVRLKDIADVELGAENYTQDVRFDGKKATFMGIWVLPTANSLDVIKRVRDAVPDIQKQLPAGMFVEIPYDSTEYIRDALKDVVKTLTETLCIVVAVIFLFLGSARGLIIPVVAIPLSLVGAAVIMVIFGFTLNLLTLLAIVLSVGLVVDDAIVVVENVERHLAEGMRPFQAAIQSARELFTPIIAMTITLAAVYVPVAIQGGLTGTLFREFALTLAGAVTISGFVALTLSPMMCSKLLRHGDADKGFAGWINRRFERVRSSYSSMLGNTLKYRPVTLVLWLLVTLLVVPFYMMSTHELAPAEDQGVVFGIVNAAPNATVDQTQLFTDKVYDVYHSFPQADHIFQLTGAGSAMSFSGMVLKPWSERNEKAAQLAFQAGSKLSGIPGVQVFCLTPPALPGGGNTSVEFVLTGPGTPEQLHEYAGQLMDAAQKSGLFMFFDTDLKLDQPESELVFDRDKVASLGLNLQQVGADVSTMMGGNYVNRFSISGQSYKVIPQVQRSERLNPDQLESLYVTGPGDQLLKLSTFAHIENKVQPRSLNHFQQLNSVKITGQQLPFATLDQALKALEEKAHEILPRGYTLDYGSESRQLRLEGSKFLPTMLLAVIVIFLVLAAQFESFRDPAVILLGSVPLALAGALMFSFLGFTSLNIYSQVGLITLVGLVAKNGILIVEFANKLQEDGESKLKAIMDATSIRLRPILMTSIATVAGHLPLIFANGPGAASRNSIGWIVVTGMFIGSFFTLFVVPAIYMVVAKDHSRGNAEEEIVDEPEAEADLEPSGV